jgi:hypothetical protein
VNQEQGSFLSTLGNHGMHGMYTKLDRSTSAGMGGKGHRRAGTPSTLTVSNYGMLLLVPPIAHRKKPLASPITPFSAYL